MKLNFSLDIAIMITIGSVLFYLIAQIHLGKYLYAFGADITILNLTIQDKLYYGFLRSLNHTLYLIAILFTVFIVSPSILRDVGITNFLRKQIHKIRIAVNKDIPHKPIIHDTLQKQTVENHLTKKFISSTILVFLFLGFIQYLSYIEKESQTSSQNDLVNFSKNLRQITIKEKLNQEAYKILCGQNLCAVLVVNGKEKSLQYIDPKEISFPLKSSNK